MEYVQKKLWRVDEKTLLIEIERAHRAGYGYVIDKALVELGGVWTSKGVEKYKQYGFTKPPSIGDEAGLRFSEQEIERMKNDGDLEHKGRIDVLNLIHSKQVRHIIAADKIHHDYPIGCVLFPRMMQEAEKQSVDEDIKMDFHSFDFHSGDVKPVIVAPAPDAPPKRQRRNTERKQIFQNTHMLSPDAP
jgi:hypothetical protein